MLQITVTRHSPRPGYTIGRMDINGTKFCDTLEDTDRGLAADMPLAQIQSIKVYGRTAIPKGTYKVSIQSWSRNKIYIHDVPGFTSVFIHAGNTPDDTLGCILVGHNTAKGRLTDSRPCHLRLIQLCQEAIRQGEPIRITIQ